MGPDGPALRRRPCRVRPALPREVRGGVDPQLHQGEARWRAAVRKLDRAAPRDRPLGDIPQHQHVNKPRAASALPGQNPRRDARTSARSTSRGPRQARARTGRAAPRGRACPRRGGGGRDGGEGRREGGREGKDRAFRRPGTPRRPAAGRLPAASRPPPGSAAAFTRPHNTSRRRQRLPAARLSALPRRPPLSDGRRQSAFSLNLIAIRHNFSHFAINIG